MLVRGSSSHYRRDLISRVASTRPRVVGPRQEIQAPAISLLRRHTSHGLDSPQRAKPWPPPEPDTHTPFLASRSAHSRARRSSSERKPPAGPRPNPCASPNLFHSRKKP